MFSQNKKPGLEKAVQGDRFNPFLGWYLLVKDIYNDSGIPGHVQYCSICIKYDILEVDNPCQNLFSNTSFIFPC